MAKRRRTEGMTWVGDGTEMIDGVPPRDLTPDEVGLYRDLIKAVQENTGRVLYEMVEADVDTESTKDTEPEDSGPVKEDDHG